MMKIIIIFLKKKILNLTKFRIIYIFLLLGILYLYKKIYLLVVILIWNCIVFGICMSYDRMLERFYRWKNIRNNGGCILLLN